MNKLLLHEFHQHLGARFATVNDSEVVEDYGDTAAEHRALSESAGVLDLSFRGRLCLTGKDRARFLHGQVTNDIARLKPGQGCYAALITAKGKMQSDLCVYCLEEELLLDFEPGLARRVSDRLEKYVIADDVQIVDAEAGYGLLSVQGPAAETVVRALGLAEQVPATAYGFVKIGDAAGEILLVNHARLGTSGFDLFVPAVALDGIAEKLTAAPATPGRACGWRAFETARIEAGIPRFGVDMDESNIPLEAELEERAVSFNKGCYIGQEVISRIRTYGHVAKALRRLVLGGTELPAHGDKLYYDGKEAGYITSATSSPALKANVALGYVRKEAYQIGNELALRTAGGESTARIAGLPFSK
jgi:folate-binding protein YgfZ